MASQNVISGNSRNGGRNSAISGIDEQYLDEQIRIPTGTSVKSSQNRVHPSILYPDDGIDEDADTSLSFKAICCCVCCTLFIVLIFLALTVLPDELSKHGIDLNEELQKHGIDFLGAESKYNKTINKTLTAKISKPRNVTKILEKL